MVIGLGRSPCLRAGPIRPGNQFEQMTVRVVEVEAATAVKVIDFATPTAVKVRIEFDARALDAESAL